MRNYFKIVSILTLTFMIIFVSGCSSDSSAPASKDGEASGDFKFELKLGHVGPADPEHSWEKYALEFAKQIEEKTNGQVVVNTFPASQLGGDREMTEGLQQGTLDIGLVSTIAMGNFVPQLQVWDLPYIFPTDNKKVDEIIEGPMGEKLAGYAKEKGLVFLAYWENDWRSMSNSERPIKTVEDMKGLKIRVVENKPSLTWFTDIGAIPTPMAWSEVYTSLQQGTVDAQDNGPIITYGSKIYEVQKYFTPIKHIYAPLTFVVSAKTWDKLPDDIKASFKELAVTIGAEQREYNRLKGEEFMTKMEENGMEITELSDEAIKGLQESAKPTYEKLASEIGQELIDEMLKYRE